MSALAFDPPSQDALAITALEALGEAVAIVAGGRILLATRAFHTRAGGNMLPAVAERLIAGGGGVDEAGPGGSLADVRACALPGGGEGWVVRLRDPAEALAALDPLTGLPNRRAFDTRLREEVARARRTGRPLSLVLLDLDRFKHINDSHGHPAGDAVLAETARRLLGAARPGDVVARVGGEEFAWIVPEAGAEEGLAAADRARAALVSTPHPGGLRVTASAGVCEIGQATGPEALYQLADQALYWSKAHGRDMTLVWTPDAAARLGRDAHEVEDSPNARRHGVDVARVAVALAVQLDWPAHRQAEMHRAARLHDIGKVALLPDVLHHPDALSQTQLDHVRQHPRIGAEMAAAALDPEPVSWIRHHHERWDGSGYPDALAGDAIPEGAQLLAVGDAYSAMTAERPYHLALSPELAISEVERCAGTQFRPDAGALLSAALRWLDGPE